MSRKVKSKNKAFAGLILSRLHINFFKGSIHSLYAHYSSMDLPDMAILLSCLPGRVPTPG